MLAGQNIPVILGNEFFNTTLPWTVGMGTRHGAKHRENPFPERRTSEYYTVEVKLDLDFFLLITARLWV